MPDIAKIEITSNDLVMLYNLEVCCDKTNNNNKKLSVFDKTREHVVLDYICNMPVVNLCN